MRPRTATRAHVLKAALTPVQTLARGVATVTDELSDGGSLLVASVGTLAVLVGPLYLASVANAFGGPSQVFWAVFLASAALLPIVWSRVVLRPAVIVAVLVTWFSIHKFLVALVAPAADPSVTAWMLNYKELLYLGLFVVLITWRAAMSRAGSIRTLLSAAARHMIAPDWLALGLVVLVTMYFLVAAFVQGSSFAQELTYARRFTSLPVMYFIGRLLLSEPMQRNRAVSALVTIALIVAVFGLVERIVLGDRFWIDFVHVDKFQAALVSDGFESSRSRLVGGLPANWITYFGGEGIRRLVSTFLEPTTLAIYFGLVLGIVLFGGRDSSQRTDRRWSFWAALAIALALMLTFGKAGAFAVAAIAFVVLTRISRSSSFWLLVVTAMAGFALIAIGQYLPLADNLNRHVTGLVSGFVHMIQQPLGGGLGTTGYWGNAPGIGSDSTVGAVASQTGLVGAVLWIAWLGSLAYCLLPQSDADVESRGRRVFAGAAVALLAISVLSNSASGLLAGAPYALFGGWFVSSLPSSTTRR